MYFFHITKVSQYCVGETIFDWQLLFYKKVNELSEHDHCIKLKYLYYGVRNNWHIVHINIFETLLH